MMDIREVSERYLASLVYKLFDKKFSCNGFEFEIMSNPELAEELHKPVTRKFVKDKVYSSFKDNIWGADLADIQLISNDLMR